MPAKGLSGGGVVKSEATKQREAIIKKQQERIEAAEKVQTEAAIGRIELYELPFRFEVLKTNQLIETPKANLTGRPGDVVIKLGVGPCLMTAAQFQELANILSGGVKQYVSQAEVPAKPSSVGEEQTPKEQ